MLILILLLYYYLFKKSMFEKVQLCFTSRIANAVRVANKSGKRKIQLHFQLGFYITPLTSIKIQQNQELSKYIY